jgi:ribosome biogenesis GTPase
MSKRRITTQQSIRIKKKQKDHIESSESKSNITHDGLVITRFGRHAEIETASKQRVHCAIRPNLESVVAGDRIVWQEEALNQGVIISIYPRQSVLIRTDLRGQLKPIAANMTQVCIVVTEEPLISWSLLDSYLVMVESLGLQPVIILNKIDLVSPTLSAEIKTIYAPLGYPIVLTGVDYAIGDMQLAKQLNQHISIFVGQSGVGKSSLISRMLPFETNILTGSLSENTGLGRHTTSSSTFYHIPTGGALIDSPGVREMSLASMQPQEIAQNYIEFRPFINQCKFRNCNHMDTPHCAIIDAINSGIILKQRYETYVNISTRFIK